jgi:hypothetical protein
MEKQMLLASLWDPLERDFGIRFGVHANDGAPSRCNDRVRFADIES